jgi:hypothetical protein
MNKLDGLKAMIDSEYFSVEMLIQYLVKYKGNFDVLHLLVDRLQFYRRDEIFKYLNELVFYSLYYNCTDMVGFLLTLSAESFNNFFRVSNAIEIWGHQFSVLNQASKAKIRSILEECENKMVNGDRGASLGSPGGFNALPVIRDLDGSPVPLHPDDLQRIVIGKRTKNDFKDEIRNFVTFLVRLSYMILNNLGANIKQIAVDCLHKLNLELFKRRQSAEETMWPHKRPLPLYVLRHHAPLQAGPGERARELIRSSASSTTRSAFSPLASAPRSSSSSRPFLPPSR